jgi:hypothetical protein
MRGRRLPARLLRALAAKLAAQVQCARFVVADIIFLAIGVVVFVVFALYVRGLRRI